MLLALDTSTRTASVALYDGTQVLAETSWTSRDYHTSEMAPVIQQALERTGMAQANLQALGVAIGPGSFTGLRIGLALAKGMALAKRIPLIGIPTLDILAAAQPALDLPLLAVLQAGRGRLAVGSYTLAEGAWQANNDLRVMEVEALSHSIQKPTLVCGELTEAQRHLLARKRKNVILASPAQALRRAGYLAELAWKRFQAGQVDDPATLAPIYLHIGEPIPA